MQYLVYFHQHPLLSANFLALLRYILSEDGHCRFCIGFSESLLLNAGMSRENLQAALQDPRNGPLESRENTLLEYVIRAVRHPHAQGSAKVFCNPLIFESVLGHEIITTL